MRQAPLGRVLAMIALASVALPIAAPMASAKPASARTNLVKAVTTADAQAKKLIARSASCPAAASQRSITTKVRKAQTKNLKRAVATSLRLRQLRITVHTQRLAVAFTRCSAAPKAGPQDPGSRGLQGSPGPQGTDGSSSQLAALPLNLLGQTLDVSSLLGGAILPDTIPVLDGPALGTSPICAVSGSVCVGIDRTGLVSALTHAVQERAAQLPALSGVLNPLLAQVTGTLATGDVSSLIDVRRTGDSTFVITAKPGSSLASLTSLLGNSGGLPNVSLGDIQVRS